MAGRGRGRRRRRRGKKRKHDQTKAQLTAELAKLKGRYFALIDQVFERDTKSRTTIATKPDATSEFEEVCRSEGQVAMKRVFRNGTKKNGTKKNGTEENAYSLTLAKAKASEASDAGAATEVTRSSSHLSKKDKIWPHSIFGVEGNGGDIAHLVPASKDHADTYWFVTHFLFGYEEERSWGEICRLIHGTKTKTKNENEKVRRIANTGLKHAVPNKIVLAGQGLHFDRNPCVLIIPICTLKQAKDWKDEGYEAIALIDTFDTELVGSLEKKRNDLAVITSNTHFGMGNPDTFASSTEVRTAYELVKKYTHAIIGAQRYCAPKFPKEPKSKSIHKGTKIVQDLLKDEFEEKYREIKLSKDLDTLKVRKIRFAAHKKDGGHPAPDPILLVTRAAVQLQRRQGISLAAAAEPQEEDGDDDVDELSALAEDDFLWKRRLLQQFELQQQMVGKEIEF